MNRFLSSKTLLNRSFDGLRFLSTQPKITTHYTIHPREQDPRWKDIDMERAADETDVCLYFLFQTLSM